MKRILIVDDESRIRQLYRALLASEGYDVLEAVNANEANELIKNQPVDLVLLDLKMPHVNGNILYEVLGLFHRKLRVIVASVYPEEQQARIAPGAAEYFDKSHSIQELLTKISHVLKQPAGHPGVFA